MAHRRHPTDTTIFRDPELEHPVIMLFDGECNVCNSFVNFIYDRDPRGQIKFASMQTQIGQNLLAKHDLPDMPDTMVLLEHGEVRLRSTAVLHIMAIFGGLWYLLFLLGILIPLFIRDTVYHIFSENRKMFMKSGATCRLPTPDFRARFLDWGHESVIRNA